ncbi:DUF2993 domain-containing protein [Gordonia amarae]|uniref:DUF2993 domain-containing protein n=2 Tax=Gordonia amarae TaxID=36821 RepID=G7GN79_9ACTN|nr:hypothetical protein [Gordonia amarae]MCS3877163.1 hypothetical protein [Gordonia amarae]QHN15950.1 DUF2993 domain-containing protein [Gordonia amarae]QHN20518.1 DUF2993 domain-containing protein [Gordonia amarae]QHN29370.1 DUF2993 domain-containing protein [Gordonia amarae]QHN38149.1 DUF2993 domain-containing protein [Gordonia amarae]
MSDEHRTGTNSGDPDQWTPTVGATGEYGPGSSPTREHATAPVDPDRTVHGIERVDTDSASGGTAAVDTGRTPVTGPAAGGESSDARFAATASRPTIPVVNTPPASPSQAEGTGPGAPVEFGPGGSGPGGSGPGGVTDPDTTKIEQALPYSSQAYSQVDGGVRVPTAPFDHGADTSYLGGQTPPPTGRGGVVASSPSRRNRGKILAWTAAVLVLVLVIGLVGSELYFRNKAQNCMEQAFGDLTGSPTSVALSKKPVLLQAMSNEFPYVQVDTKNEAGTGMKLHARAEGIKRSGDDTTIRALDGTGFVPFDRVTELGEQAQSQNQNQSGGGLIDAGKITKVSGNAADGTVSIDASVTALFVSIPVSTVIKPVVKNGKPKFEVQKASAFVFGVPADFAQQIVDQVSTTMFGTFFDEVTIDNLKVTDSGVDFTVSGSDVKLIADNNTVAGNTVKCG